MKAPAGPPAAAPSQRVLTLLRRPPRVVRYLLSGGTAATVHLITLALLVERAGVHPVLGSVVGFGAGLIVSYTLQRWYVFGSTRAHRSAVPRFLTVTGLALALNTAIVAIGTGLIGWHYGPVQVVAFLSSPVANYLLNSRWTFR